MKNCGTDGGPVSGGLTEGSLFRSVTRHGKLQAGRLSDRTRALIVKRSAEAEAIRSPAFADSVKITLQSGISIPNDPDNLFT